MHRDRVRRAARRLRRLAAADGSAVDPCRAAVGRRPARARRAPPSPAASRPDRRRSDRRWPRCFRDARGAGARGHAVDRHPDLHLAPTHRHALFEEVLSAAERGVRVRLLLDDLNTAGRIHARAARVAPEHRAGLYNPFVGRGSRMLGFLADFERLNHRMHNKSFTVDGVVTIVGGRNIADEYYEIGERNGSSTSMSSPIGDAVRQVSTSSTCIWNSASAYPAELIIGDVGSRTARRISPRASGAKRSATPMAYARREHRTRRWSALLAGTVRSNGPLPGSCMTIRRKRWSATTSAMQLLFRIARRFGRPIKSLDIVSPYSCRANPGPRPRRPRPGRRSGADPHQLAGRDRREVGAHRLRKHRGAVARPAFNCSSSSPRRADHREAGRRDRQEHSRPRTPRQDLRRRQPRIFVGSFNLDPRSAKLNTEMGLVIDSGRMATQLSHAR